MQVLLYVLYEFAVVHLSVLILVVMLQTSLRAAVCANFFKKGLTIANKQKYVIPLITCYFAVVGFILMCTMVLSFMPGRAVNCNSNLFSNLTLNLSLSFLTGYHWYIIGVLDLC